MELGIANLLSVLQLERDGFVINYNTNCGWTVTTPDGVLIPFKQDAGECKGFPYIEMGSIAAQALFQPIAKVEIVKGNVEGYTKRDVEKAVLARTTRKAQAMIGRPTDHQFRELVSDNCSAQKTTPVTFTDLSHARTILAPIYQA